MEIRPDDRREEMVRMCNQAERPSKTTSRFLRLSVLTILAAATQLGGASATVELRFQPSPEVGLLAPPLPPASLYPVQLVLDDDSPDGNVGVVAQAARQFLWFNRFTPGTSFNLQEVWVLFSPGPEMAVGNSIEIAVYQDPDGDPTNGATLLASFNDFIQVLDGSTFSIYTLPDAVAFDGVGDLWIGVVPRFIVSGVTPPVTPAALDTDGSQQRSWIGVWTGDPPSPPVVIPVPDQQLSLVDTFLPGNWMIRGFGTGPATVEVPTLGTWGLVALALLLAGAAAALLRRRATVSAGLLLLLLLPAGPAAAQVTIDTFTTNHPAILAPPGGASSVATGGADIIKLRRGLSPTLLAGAGAISTSVSAGRLNLTVPDTTPNSRGETEVVWDGDANPLVLSPTGLVPTNLTSGSSSGFRIVLASSTVVSELELIVYSNATDVSRAGRRLPVAGSPQTFFLPYSEFIVTGGAGANFTDVGAIVMILRSGEGTVQIDEVVTSAPILAATKVDAQIVDTDGDGRVDPGDRVRYTVTLTNTGQEALNVDLDDTVDVNTALVGATSATPIARNDQYLWAGNVTLQADGSPGRPGLLANDDDPDGDTVTVQSVATPSAQGGSVTLVNAATGTFTYVPPAGFAGVDTFSYTIVDDNANVSTATAVINLDGVIWFVDDSNTTPPHNGTLADPFQTLASLQGTDPDAPGDTIFVYNDDGTPYAGGLVLEDDQTLIGEAEGLVVFGATIVPVGGRPDITNAAGAGLTLGVDVEIRGLDVVATSGAGILGSNFGTLTVANTNVLNAAGSALDLTNGALAATFGTLSSTGAGLQRGIQLVTITGSLAATTTSLTNPTTHGIRVANSAGATFNFGATTITDNSIGAGPTATSIDVATGNAGAAFTFASLAVTTDGGTGLLASNSGTINVAGSSNTIVATGGPAVDVTTTSFGSGVTFSTLSSTNSAGDGVNLDGVTGNFIANGGSISNPTGIGFDLNAGSATVTYAGSLSNTANQFLVEITGRTGGTTTLSGNLSGTSSSNGVRVASNTGGTINFTGSTKTLNTGADAAVTLATNTGATINFTGGNLDIDTTSGAGFSATGGATGISVQGSGNSLTSTTGTALNVTSTTIAAAGLNFQSIAANGATNGIVLNATGALGGLTVTGSGSTTQGGDFSGGTLTTTGDAISLVNTRNVSLTNIRVQNVGTGPGDGAGAIDATNLQGTNLLRASTITGMGSVGGAGGTNRNGVNIINTDTNLTLFTAENCVFSNSDGTSSFIFTSARGTSNMGVTITTSDFSDLVALAVQVNAGDSETGVHTVTSNISNNVFRNASPADGQGGIAVVAADQDATHVFTVSNNQFFDLIKGIAGGNSEILLAQTTGGALNGTISGNTIGTASFGNGDRRGIGVISEPDVSVNGELGSVDVIIDGNIVNRLTDREAIFVDLREDTTDSELIIRNNVIGQLTGFEGQVGGIREAVDVQTRGEVTRTLNLLMSNNNIRTTSSVSAVNLEVNIDNATPGNLTMHATVSGNTIRNTGTGDEMIVRPRDAGAVTTLCLDMTANTIDGGGGLIDLNETGVLNVEQASAAALAAANGIPAGNVVISGGAPSFGVVCLAPPT